MYSLFIFSYLSFNFVYSHVQAKLSDLTKNDLIQLISHLEHEVGYRDSVINDMMVCLMSSLRHSIVVLLRLNIGWSCYTMISRRLVDNILPQVHPIWNLSGSTFTTPSLLYLLPITSYQQWSSSLVVCICRLAGSRPAACMASSVLHCFYEYYMCYKGMFPLGFLMLRYIRKPKAIL